MSRIPKLKILGLCGRCKVWHELPGGLDDSYRALPRHANRSKRDTDCAGSLKIPRDMSFLVETREEAEKVGKFFLSHKNQDSRLCQRTLLRLAQAMARFYLVHAKYK